MSQPTRFSVAFPKRWWYPACRSHDLGRHPRRIELMGTPLAVFRDRSGRARALLDRCPHRNYPLSLGRVTDEGALECGYHGWRFDGCGECVGVPGLTGSEPAAANRAVPTRPAREQDGFVWVWGDPDAEVDREPLALPRFDGPRTGETVFARDLDCTLHSALENALDVPHTAFLHGGVFRGGEPREITALRRPLAEGIEVQYLGEPVGFGPIRRREDATLTFDHWDRFLMPSIAQIEYRVEGWIHVVNTILHLPMSPFRTRAWFVLRYRTRLPAPLVRPVVRLRGIQILRQDARALAHQTESVRAFGGERYTSTELDVMGNAIWRMLRHAERVEEGAATEAGADGDGQGDGHGPAIDEREITLRI